MTKLEKDIRDTIERCGVDDFGPEIDYPYNEWKVGKESLAGPYIYGYGRTLAEAVVDLRREWAEQHK